MLCKLIMEQDLKMEADSTLPECGEGVGIPTAQDDGGSEEPSAQPEDNRKEAPSLAVQEDIKIIEEFRTEQLDDRNVAEIPVVQEVMNTHDTRNSSENDIKLASFKKKNAKVLKVKRKVIKKSPAGSLLKFREAQSEPADVKKEKESPAAQVVSEALDAGNDAEPSAEHEDNRKEAVSSAVQEDKKVKEESPAVQVDAYKEVEAHVIQAGNSAEKCIKEESCKKNFLKVLKEERNFFKQSPAGSSLEPTREAHGEPEDSKKKKEVPVTQEVSETLEAGNSSEKCSKSESSSKKSYEVLKARRKIAKKSPAGSLLKSNKAPGSLTVQDRWGEENDKSDAEQLNQKEDVKNSVSKEEHVEKSEETRDREKKISDLKNSCQEQTNEVKGGSSDKGKKNEKNKRNDVEKVQRKKIKKKLGGLIFICNAKTRPDCFRYHVMGVSSGKKDTVLAIKPGLKLFLYDCDFKLLYGIYRASSSGGMKLEPKAFRGALPAQVRFKVFKDCVPLPETVFKKAIKENDYEKHKFRVKLTVEQVRKLSRLFRPVGFLSSASVRPPPRGPIRDRNVHARVVEVRSRDRHSKSNARNYRLISHERDRKIEYRDEVPRHREEASRDLYGFRMERRNLDPVPHPALHETYHRDYDKDYHRHPEPRYMVSARREPVHADPVYFNGKDYPVYGIDPRPELSPPREIFASGSERYARDPYYTRDYAPLSPYLLPSRREEVPPLPYSARNYVDDTKPVRLATDALSYDSYYNHRHHGKLETEMMPVSSRYHEKLETEMMPVSSRYHEKLETEMMPVSSRYSFAGPSYSYC